MTSPRISSVDYLNARPLTRGFTHGPSSLRCSITETSPARCADLLSSEEVEVGLIPSIEFQRISGARVLPQISIASRQQSGSVLLVSKVAAPEIRSVAVDLSSRTSAALLRILLARRARDRVEYQPFPPDLPVMLKDCDAALLIGDAALRAGTHGYRVYDLATEWFDMTGLPFVFAFWAVRRGVGLTEGIRPFVVSRKIGLESIDRIALEESTRLGLPAPGLSHYLKANIHFSFGEEEIRSLGLFYRLAREAGVLPGCRELEFYEPVPGQESLARARGMQ